MPRAALARLAAGLHANVDRRSVRWLSLAESRREKKRGKTYSDEEKGKRGLDLLDVYIVMMPF
jgi:hypothetical protein